MYIRKINNCFHTFLQLLINNIQNAIDIAHSNFILLLMPWFLLSRKLYSCYQMENTEQLIFML